MLGALLWVHGLGLGSQTEMILQVIVLLIGTGLIFVWVGASQAAFLNSGEAIADNPTISAAPLAEPETRAGLEPEALPAGAPPPAADLRGLQIVITGRVLD